MQGYWTYEYCHLSHVRQFHTPAPNESPSSPALSFYLGRYPENTLSMTDLVEADADGKSYLKEIWGDGTECDLTRGPRITEIQVSPLQISSLSLSLVFS